MQFESGAHEDGANHELRDRATKEQNHDADEEDAAPHLHELPPKVMRLVPTRATNHHTRLERELTYTTMHDGSKRRRVRTRDTETESPD